MMPTKPLGISGGTPGVMMGAGARKAMPTAASDGLRALASRLATAKKQKSFKNPTKKGRQKPDLSATGTGTAAEMTPKYSP